MKSVDNLKECLKGTASKQVIMKQRVSLCSGNKLDTPCFIMKYICLYKDIQESTYDLNDT